MKMTEYLKSKGFTKAALVNGPNGKFISAEQADGSKATYPVGKRSQAGTLDEFQALEAENGQVIATVNHYEQVEAIAL